MCRWTYAHLFSYPGDNFPLHIEVCASGKLHSFSEIFSAVNVTTVLCGGFIPPCLAMNLFLCSLDIWVVLVVLWTGREIVFNTLMFLVSYF